MIKLLDWILEDPELNIPYAAFFHDILLETDIWATIRSDESVKKISLDELQKEKISRHAELTAKFFEPWDSVPNEACRVIKEHHGSTSGRGFNVDPDKISNLSKTFLVAEEWVNSLLPYYQKKEEKQNKELLINKLKHRFSGKGYNELIGALELLEIVDMNSIVEFWEKRDQVDIKVDSLDVKMYKSGLFSEEELDQWIIVNFLRSRLEVILAKPEEYLLKKDSIMITSLLDKAAYLKRILDGAFSEDKPPTEIEPEVMKQINECYFSFDQDKKNIYDLTQRFRYTFDIKETDLMIASALGNIAVVKYLIENDLEKVDAYNLEGKTPLLYAIVTNHLNIVDYLLEKEAKLDQVDRMRRGPLYYSLIHGHEDLFFKLVELGARSNQQAIGGVSLPMVCALKGHQKALIHLVEVLHSDLNCQDSNRKTIIDYAKKGKNKGIIEYVKNNI